MFLIIVPQVKGQRREKNHCEPDASHFREGSLPESVPASHCPKCDFFSFHHLYEPNPACMCKIAQQEGVSLTTPADSEVFFLGSSQKITWTLTRYYWSRLVLNTLRIETFLFDFLALWKDLTPPRLCPPQGKTDLDPTQSSGCGTGMGPVGPFISQSTSTNLRRKFKMRLALQQGKHLLSEVPQLPGLLVPQCASLPRKAQQWMKHVPHL